MAASPWEAWPARWEDALRACKAHGGEARPLIIAPPATQEEVAAVEAELGLSLPESFRTVVLEFSKHVEVFWSLPAEKRPSQELRGVFAGDCHWNLAWLPDLEQRRQHWIAGQFHHLDDPYDRVWHRKLPFMRVATGDLLALDLSIPDRAPVIYLSHDGSDLHGATLGYDFVDFIGKRSLLGCPGPEDWQFKPFLSGLDRGLAPHGVNARHWRKWFGLNL